MSNTDEQIPENDLKKALEGDGDIHLTATPNNTFVATEAGTYHITCELDKDTVAATLIDRKEISDGAL